MTTMTATEAKSMFGELMVKAQAEPIRVSKSGRDTVVIISADEYDRLSELDDRYWGEQALEVVRTQRTLGVEATAKWLERLVGGPQ